jgi:hypothetical protein
MPRPQKITFGEMRSSGVRGLLIYCSDHHCSHSIAISADPWPAQARLSDLEPRFVCKACGNAWSARPAVIALRLGEPLATP